MVGKFLLVALVCVSLAQVHGDELDNAVAKGLNRARGLNENGKRRINAAVTAVGYKSRLVQVKTEDYIQRAVRVQDASRAALRNVASAMEEKAEEMNKPDSVFECIRRNEEKGNSQIETLTNKFRGDMERLRNVKLENIKTDSRPLNGMQESLRVRFNRAVKEIRNCETVRCVDNAVNSFSRWLDSMFADIGRIQGQVATILNNFQRDANNYFGNSNRQITRIKSTSLRAIRNCLYRREAIFENF